MKTFRHGMGLLKKNMASIFLYEILYRLVLLSVITPLLYSLLNYSIRLAGISYISKATLRRYLLSPSTYLLIFAAVIIVTVYVFIHISGLIYAMDASNCDVRIHPLEMLIRSIANTLRVFLPSNIGMLRYIIFILPFTYATFISGTLISLKLPDYMKSFISRHSWLMLAIAVLGIAVSLWSVTKVFAINFYTLRKYNSRVSLEKSEELIKKKKLLLLLGLISLNLLIIGAMLGVEWIIAFGASKVLRHVTPIKAFNFALTTSIKVSFLVVYLMFSVVSAPIIYSYICAAFYERQGSWGTENIQKELKLKPMYIGRMGKVITTLVVIVTVCLNGIYVYLIINKRVNINILRDNYTLITAHRGDSANAPENTMAAFELAWENQADIIEIDVRQTGDGEYVIIHDENLRRTTGVNRKVQTVDYEYIRSLDAGSKFSDEYEGEKIPTLREVLEFAVENDVVLNIELKPAKSQKGYTEGVLELVEEYDYLDNVMIASSDYNIIKAVKEYDEDIKTIYIMSLFLGRLDDMDCADVISVKFRYLNADLVSKAHSRGMEVYAWTVNDEKDVNNLLLMGVDSIITDSPYEMKRHVYTTNENILDDIFKNMMLDY